MHPWRQRRVVGRVAQGSHSPAHSPLGPGWGSGARGMGVTQAPCLTHDSESFVLDGKESAFMGISVYPDKILTE